MAPSRHMFTSERGDWRTPIELFAKVHTEFRFQIDVCASRDNSQTLLFFDKDQDALTQDWAAKRCWMNPPYGRGIEQWIAKAWEEAQKGATVVCLLPARVDTIWFHDVVLPNAKEVRFLKGRLHFDDGDGRATFPSMLVVFKPPLRHMAHCMLTEKPAKGCYCRRKKWVGRAKSGR